MTCNSLDCRHLPHYSRSFIGLYSGHAPFKPTAHRPFGHRLSHLTLLCIAKRFNLLTACQQDCHGCMSCFYFIFPQVFLFSLFLAIEMKFPALHEGKWRIYLHVRSSSSVGCLINFWQTNCLPNEFKWPAQIKSMALCIDDITSKFAL